MWWHHCSEGPSRLEFDFQTRARQCLRLIEFSDISFKISPSLLKVLCETKLLASCWCTHNCVEVLHTVWMCGRGKKYWKKLSTHNINCNFTNVYGGSIRASTPPGKHISGKRWTVSQYLWKNTWLIILLEEFKSLFCFATCVLYIIFLLYLANLSSCQHLRVALQSVIYVYWWPCGQGMGS